MDKFDLRKIQTFNQLCRGVSANKVDKVVDIVLTQISGIQVDGLPKSTFAKDMTIESRVGTISSCLRALSRELYQYDTLL